jgi:hypothetical protein
MNPVARFDMLNVRTIGGEKTRGCAIADIIAQGQRKGKQTGPKTRTVGNGFPLQFKKAFLGIRILPVVRIKESGSAAYHHLSQGLPVFKTKIGDHTSPGVLHHILASDNETHFFALRQADEFLPGFTRVILRFHFSVRQLRGVNAG